MIIYKITNKFYGTSYIGQTVKTLHQRWRAHISAASKGSPWRIHCAIRKYGPDAFLVEEICSCSSLSELSEVEKICIEIFDTKIPNGYNMTDGGEGTPGHKRGVKGRIFSDEHRKKIGDAHRGRTLPIEQRLKMSASQRAAAKRRDPEMWKDACKRSSEKQRGREVSAETRAKMSESAKKRFIRDGHWITDDVRKKIGESQKGKKVPDETRAKQSAAAKRRYARLREPQNEHLSHG